MRSKQVIVFKKKSTKVEIPQLGIPVVQITFETATVPELHTLAKHRILHFPTFVFLDERNKVIAKIQDTVPSELVSYL